MTDTRNQPAGHRRLPPIRPLGVAALLALALLPGCGTGDKTPHVASVAAGSPSAPAGTDRGSQIQHYSDCLRGNGVTLLDQPTDEGMPQIDKERTNIGVVNTAEEKCRQYLPSAVNTAGPDPQAIEAQRRLAECLRAHGVPDYPDPDPATGDARVSDELAGRLKTDPTLASALRSCQQQVPPAAGGGKIGG
jgi:hypothetical protein